MTPDPALEPEESESPVFRDWLAPTQTLTVGKERYVSPCQALSLADVREIYGEPPSGTSTFETFLDFSVRDYSFIATGYGTDCTYDGVVRLSAEQDSKVSDLRLGGLGSALTSYGDQDLPLKIRRFRAAAAESDDPELAAFIDGIVDVSERYLRYLKDFDDKALRGLTFDTVVQPTGQSAYAFYFFVGNVTYTLVQEEPEGSSGLKKAGDSYVLDQLSRAQRAIARIREHATDPELSQSPAPTIAATDDSFGRTRLLEPCAVVSREVFADVTGRADNQPVERRSLPIQPTQLPPSWEGPNGLTSNECERIDILERKDGSSTTTRLGVLIEYFPSAKRALRSIPRGGSSLLDTDADLALETIDEGFGVTLYRFVVGPYRVTLNYSRLESSGFLGDLDGSKAPRAEQVRAINTLVRSLQRHLKAAERTDGR